MRVNDKGECGVLLVAKSSVAVVHAAQISQMHAQIGYNDCNNILTISCEYTEEHLRADQSFYAFINMLHGIYGHKTDSN